MAVDIEFMRWYQPGTELWRCGGDRGCGALLVSGDMELHTKWHERVDPVCVSDPVPMPLKRGNW